MKGLAASLDALPKVELHCHLEGTMRPTTLEYGEVARALGLGWQEMVGISLDGVEACGLDATAKAALRRRVAAAAPALAPDDGA